MGIRLCSLTNPLAYEDEEWMRLHRELEAYSIDKHVFSTTRGDIYRKGWEWTQTVYGLQKLGAVRPGRCGLGVGAGHEPLIFWLADRIDRVVATDLYGGEGWSTDGGREADASALSQPSRFCPRPFNLKAVEFRVMDGRRLDFKEGTFDFVWSCSSIEHFGGHGGAAEAMREMARVVRPEGIVAVATEYVLLEDQRHSEYFNRTDLDQFIVKASPFLELVEPIDFSLPSSSFLVDSIVFPQGVTRTRRHVVLNDGEVQWTSIMLFFRRKPDSQVPQSSGRAE